MDTETQKSKKKVKDKVKFLKDLYEVAEEERQNVEFVYKTTLKRFSELNFNLSGVMVPTGFGKVDSRFSDIRVFDRDDLGLSEVIPLWNHILAGFSGRLPHQVAVADNIIRSLLGVYQGVSSDLRELESRLGNLKSRLGALSVAFSLADDDSDKGEGLSFLTGSSSSDSDDVRDVIEEPELPSLEEESEVEVVNSEKESNEEQEEEKEDEDSGKEGGDWEKVDEF